MGSIQLRDYALGPAPQPSPLSTGEREHSSVLLDVAYDSVDSPFVSSTRIHGPYAS
jgi:hypothetical protein